ncbi:hypothetical protein GF345_04415 [Candidatus Woesearchaeota archaeon]|nr:hypothetical protein [Candidatus Woesearchaeota archaeon]
MQSRIHDSSILILLAILSTVSVLLLTAGCSQVPEDAGEIIEGTGDGTDDASSGGADGDSKDEMAAEECNDQCYEINAWCARDKFYACVQEPGCKKQVFVKECDEGYTCENNFFCVKEGEPKEGILVMEQLMQAAPSIQGEPGDDFKLDFLGEELSCTVTEILSRTALFECE